MAYKHIFWDFNGTLADDVKAALAAVNDMLERKGRKPITLGQYYEYVETPIIGFYRHIKPWKLWVLFPVTMRRKHLLFCFSRLCPLSSTTAKHVCRFSRDQQSRHKASEPARNGKFSFASSWESEGEDWIPRQMPSGLGAWGWHCLARAVRPSHEGMDGGGVFC